MKKIAALLIIVISLYACKKTNDQPNDEEYQFITSHVLKQKMGWINELFYLYPTYECVNFRDNGDYQIIYRSEGRLHGLTNNEYVLDTSSGRYNYDSSTKQILFLGKDSLIILPGYLSQMPEGGVLYLKKAAWQLRMENDSTLFINGTAGLDRLPAEILIWDGGFYLEELVDE